MKRFAILFAVIVALVAVFAAAIHLKTLAGRPDVLLKRLKAGSGDAEDIKMRLNLAHEDPVPAMIEAYSDAEASADFRADVLKLLFSKYARSRDERILPILQAAVKSPDVVIRRTAVDGFDLYGETRDRLSLLGCVNDSDPAIRRKTYTVLTSGVGRSDLWDEMTAEQRSALIKTCRDRMATEADPETRFLARSVIGREIEFLCQRAREAVDRGDIGKGEKFLQDALALDPTSQNAKISLVRYYLAADMKKKALELGDRYGAILHVPKLAAAPVVDGDPTDKAWDKAFRYVDKPFYHGTSRWVAKTVDGKTDMYIGHLDGTVYVAVIGYEKDLGKLIIRHTGRDTECWKDDCVELFFDPANTGTYGYQFVINPVGALFDYCIKDRDRTRNWPCRAAAKIFNGRHYWACEFAIAGMDLENHPLAADSLWGINIARTRIGPAAEQCIWWPTYGYSLRFNLYPLAVFDGLDKPSSAPKAK